MMDSARQERHHFVLVHGLCHGAWRWYKVAAALESAGHRVTALDMAASGAQAQARSFEDYSRPLLDAVNAAPDGDRLVLVGHSFGGHNLALAMERFPRKVAAAVFVSAPMPVPGRPMSMVLEQHLKGDSTHIRSRGERLGESSGDIHSWPRMDVTEDVPAQPCRGSDACQDAGQAGADVPRRRGHGRGERPD